ncbi:MAG: methionine--tRNA ligase [bacterium]|nr:methionine--tRNA ligase [bacterium]
MEENNIISIGDLAKVELRVGTVTVAEAVEGSEKLLRLSVDIGEENPRQILAGMAQFYTPAGITGLQVVVVANLAPRMMMGFESQGMLLAAGDRPVLLSPGKHISNGSKIR